MMRMMPIMYEASKGVNAYAQHSLTLWPACSPRYLVPLFTRVFSQFVASLTAPVASGRSESDRVGFAPTGKAPP